MKKKYFYGSDGFIYKLLDYSVSLLDSNDDIGYISLTEEQVAYLQNHTAFRSYWSIVDDKLKLAMVQPEEIKAYGNDVYDSIQAAIDIENENIKSSGLFDDLI